jgi:periodic tryptophan protein 2
MMAELDTVVLSMLCNRTKCVRFAPTGLQWAAASTQGLLLYSLDDSLTFDPSELDLDITPANTEKAIADKAYSRALTVRC